MKAATYDYAKPLACDEAIALVTPNEGMAKFVSGSQSLGPMMNLRLAQPEMLVDLRASRHCAHAGSKAMSSRSARASRTRKSRTARSKPARAD